MCNVYVGTNWKMNKTLKEAEVYLNEFKTLLNVPDNFQIFIVAPFTHLWRLKELSASSSIWIGAQNMHWADSGAFTGEVSPAMLAEIGVNIVELGHSERRAKFNETDIEINLKVIAALKHGLIPLICVGEQKIEKDLGVMKEIIARQIKIALHDVADVDYAKLWLAYEPVWAIGEGAIAAEPEYIGEAHTYIRQILLSLYGNDRAENIPILYGGSVNSKNAASIVQQSNVDGLFIGRAGWEATSFINVIDAVVMSNK